MVIARPSRRCLSAFLRNALALLSGGVAWACGGTETTSPPPTVSVSVTPARDTLTVSTGATFSATVSGSSNTAVTWSVVEGAGGGSITGGGVYTASATPGTYHVVATSQASSSAKDTATVLVVPPPDPTITAPATVETGSTGNTASVPSFSGSTYQWSITNGTITAGATGRIVTFTAGSAGTLTLQCQVTNPAGTSADGSADVSVVDPPPPPVIDSWTADRETITVGEGAILTPVFHDGVGTVDQGIGNVTSGVAIPVGPLTVATTYVLTVTSPTNVVVTASVTVTPVPPPEIFEFSQLAYTVARGDSVRLFPVFLPAGSATIAPAIGSVVAGNYVWTGAVQTTTVFTLTVANAAEATVEATLTVEAVDPVMGAFSAVGDPVVPRTGGSATLLTDGRVLFVGGLDDAFTETATAELYDPTTQSFGATGSLGVVREDHAAVLLPDGRVLVTGGRNESSTAIWDPTTGMFTPGGDLLATRNGHTATVLSDGRVLIAGGFVAGTSSNTAEVFDPATGVSVATGTLPSVRTGHSAALLPDGRVLLLGGRGPGGVASSTTDLYDPSTETFSASGSFGDAHRNGTVTQLQDGRLLVVGGTSASAAFNPLRTVEVYDPMTGIVSPAGNMAHPRAQHAAALLPDGRVLITGGWDDNVAPEIEAGEVYDPVTGTLTPTAPMVTPRQSHVAIALPSGGVLIVGGRHRIPPSEVPVSSAEVFQ